VRLDVRLALVTFSDGSQWTIQGDWSDAADNAGAGYPNSRGQRGRIDGHWPWAAGGGSGRPPGSGRAERALVVLEAQTRAAVLETWSS